MSALQRPVLIKPIAHTLWVSTLAAVVSTACGGSSPSGPSNPSSPSPSASSQPLGAVPGLVSPVGGTQVSSDSPTFIARNARGFDSGQANYTFEVMTQSMSRQVATMTVAAGRETTTATFAAPLPRGMTLVWRVTARGSAGEAASTTSTFRLPAVDCHATRDPYAKSVVSWFVPACSLAGNQYNDPNEVLGPPNAGGFGPFNYRGFFSLGEDGWVVVDMEGCAVDQPGTDLRVYQAVGSEPVTVYAGGTPTGPWELLEYRKTCGDRVPGEDKTIRECEFDLAAAEVQEARYFKIEDGELYPCALAETPSEGADIDAVQLLHIKP
jgi:hypothetical protein